MSINDVITEYYELKGQYYSKYNRLKHKILRSDSSISIKRKKVKRIKMKCINCKKMSGTIFERNDKVISAVCGDTIDPCNLDIKINTGIYDTTTNLNSLTYDSLEQSKFKIMQIKFLLLFNLGEEMELIADFNTLKVTYKSFVQLQDLIDHVIKTNNSIKMDTVEGEKHIDRNVLADINIIKLDNLISSFKELLTNYQDEKNSAAQSGIMIDAMDLYINEIIPTEKNIQENLYNVKQVFKEGDLYKVVQIKTKLDDKMIELLEPELLSNKK